jgi:hypothetical protein
MQMKDGLYSVRFQTSKVVGTGVVFLQNGKLRGGDTSMWYSGQYTDSAGKFTANVAVARHAQGLLSVFGIDNLNIVLTGNSTDTTGQASGYSPQVTGVSFSASFSRLSD